MRGILRFGALCALAACGGGGGGGGDGGPPDTRVPDAAPDAPPDGPPTPPGVHRWVIDNQLIPKNNPEAAMYGFDLNGDAIVDNQLGLVFVAFTGQGFNLQAATDTAVSRGGILMLGEAGVANPAAATYTMYTGANPQPPPCNGPGDLVCRRHLQGTGSFTLATGSAHDPPLTGTLSGGTLTAGPGHLQISLVLMGETPVVLNLIGARVRLQMVADGSVGQSVIAGGVSVAERDAKLYPAMLQGVSAMVAMDCSTTIPPDCGCAAGSNGRTFLQLFDTMPKDCTITLDEIRNNTLIQALFAPDVMLEGQMALSLGFAITAKRATYMP